MLLDLRQQGPVELAADRVRRWGDRHRGVGFDQLLVLDPPGDSAADAAVRIWNADGSSAEQCGNGMRAIGLYLARFASSEGGFAAGEYRVRAPRAELALLVHPDSRVSVGMGAAAFGPATVPYTGPLADGQETGVLEILGEPISFGLVSIGNPHAVITVDDAATAPLTTLGRALRDHDSFPHSCNVGFVQRLADDAIRLRVLERGAGETLACGSGACAAVAWLAHRGQLGRKVRVEMGGGTLEVETDRGVGPITLTGPATHVFEGTIE